MSFIPTQFFVPVIQFKNNFFYDLLINVYATIKILILDSSL